MKKSQYIGKQIDHDGASHCGHPFSEIGTDSEDRALLRIGLADFELLSFTDKHGRNAYSLDIFIDSDNVIREISRTGHCHMCDRGAILSCNDSHIVRSRRKQRPRCESFL